MGLKSYRALATNSRFLRGVAFDSGQSGLTKDDRTEAENLAAVEIDSALSTTFTAVPGAVPPVIALLGDLLGSAYLYEFIALQGNLGEKGEATNKPAYLRKKAQQIIDDLRAHKIGVQNADGSWNALYPAPSILPLATVGDAKNLSIDAGLAWGQMAQGTMSDTEKRELDTARGRRSSELEAALAGAYGL